MAFSYTSVILAFVQSLIMFPDDFGHCFEDHFPKMGVNKMMKAAKVRKKNVVAFQGLMLTCQQGDLLVKSLVGS